MFLSYWDNFYSLNRYLPKYIPEIRLYIPPNVLIPYQLSKSLNQLGYSIIIDKIIYLIPYKRIKTLFFSFKVWAQDELSRYFLGYFIHETINLSKTFRKSLEHQMLFSLAFTLLTSSLAEGYSPMLLIMLYKVLLTTHFRRHYYPDQDKSDMMTINI